MSIWHVENPSVASLEPGTVLQQSDTTTTWTCVQSGAPGCGGTSNDFVDDVGMQPELLNGEVVTDWYGLTPNGNAQDGNVYGWDITDQSGNGAVAMAPKVTKNNATWSANLTGLWQLGEGAGGTTYDLSGNGNHGTLTNGASWTTGGRVGAALDFDGVNDYVAIPDPSGFYGGYHAMTWNFWLNPDVLGGNRVILDKTDVVRLYVQSWWHHIPICLCERPVERWLWQLRFWLLLLQLAHGR